jgi:hypothetical protein
VSATRPGHDQILLTAPEGRQLCNDRAHRDQGWPAQVIVIFGRLGVPGTPRDACWPECWERPCPMCGPCWQATRHKRPGPARAPGHHRARPAVTANSPARAGAGPCHRATATPIQADAR